MPALELINTTLINDANLLSYYRLESSSVDSKGTANLTDTTVTYQSSPAMFGNSANYNGSASKSHGTRTTGLSGSFTVMGWINQSATQQTAIFESGVASYTNYWAYGNANGAAGKLNFALFDGTNNPNIIGGTNLALTTWYMVTFVRDTTAGKILLYLNASSDATAVTDTTTSTPVYSDFDLGARNQGGPNWFAGNLDDFAVFSRALSATEISNHYNGLDALTASTTLSSLSLMGVGT